MMITHSLCTVQCWHVFVCAFTSQSDYVAMVVYPLHFEDEIFRVLAGQPIAVVFKCLHHSRTMQPWQFILFILKMRYSVSWRGITSHI
ncbi:hypothetical protein HanRHA438_Chr08g0329211 [Helianthus annuus]|nr:hypothetical protein HanRHA438_Chr08g0329211 [Helianthus annuus]